MERGELGPTALGPSLSADRSRLRWSAGGRAAWLGQGKGPPRREVAGPRSPGRDAVSELVCRNDC